MKHKTLTIIWLSLIGLSISIVFITAITYPKLSDFTNSTPTILFIAGMILGIAIPLSFKRDMERKIIK